MLAGAWGLGNKTAAAERNVLCDPEAAAIVFGCSAPLTLIPIDAAAQGTIDDALVESARAIGGRIGAFAAELLVSLRSTFRRGPFGPHEAPLDDLLATLLAANPALVRRLPARVEIELAGKHAYGRTVVDFAGRSPLGPNCEVALEFDVAATRRAFIDALAALKMRDREPGGKADGQGAESAGRGFEKAPERVAALPRKASPVRRAGAFRAQAAFTTICEACEPSRETRLNTIHVISHRKSCHALANRDDRSGEIVAERHRKPRRSHQQQQPSAVPVRATDVDRVHGGRLDGDRDLTAAGLPRGKVRISKRPPDSGPRHIAATRVDAFASCRPTSKSAPCIMRPL